MAEQVTIATMVFTDGQRTAFRVYRATLRGRRRQYINLNAPDTREVATECFGAGEGPHATPDLHAGYLALATRYATPEAPAFSWPNS